MPDQQGTARSQNEIVARIAVVADDDWMGNRRDVLVSALDYDHAKPFLKEGVGADDWKQDTDAVAKSRDYLEFAIGKATDHRGLSANRSVEKLGEWAWLAGRDDVVTAMDAADYQNYGVPKLKAFAEGMGFDWPTGQPDLDRMALGFACGSEYDCGCGQ